MSFRVASQTMFRNFLSLTLLGFASGAAFADAPYIDPADDSQHFGDIYETLFWSPAEKVAGFRNMPLLTETRTVPAGDKPYPLPGRSMDLADFRFEFEGAQYSVDDYMRQLNVAGLLIVKDGAIAYEKYALGNNVQTSWISFSVAKSVTSLLVGAAIQDGYIASVDEKVSDYLPRLKNSAYDDVTIRHLMQMASGVEWNEDYADPDSDINTIVWDTLDVYEQLRDKPRFAASGEAFNYNTAETNLVGTLVRSAVGNNLSTYLSEKIWKPFGMQYDATWNLTEAGGGEFGGSSLNATLRDYARIGPVRVAQWQATRRHCSFAAGLDGRVHCAIAGSGSLRLPVVAARRGRLCCLRHIRPGDSYRSGQECRHRATQRARGGQPAIGLGCATGLLQGDICAAFSLKNNEFKKTHGIMRAMKFLDQLEKYAAIALLALMGLIVVSATLEVGYEIATNLFAPPGFFIGVRDLFELFGLFLMVLIGLELMASIRMYLEDHRIHAEVMLLVAITAITRKIVILDATQMEPMILFGIGFIVIALTAGYLFVRRSKDAAQ